MQAASGLFALSGGASGCYIAGLAVVAPALSRLIDRHGPRWALFCCGVAFPATLVHPDLVCRAGSDARARARDGRHRWRNFSAHHSLHAHVFEAAVRAGRRARGASVSDPRPLRIALILCYSGAFGLMEIGVLPMLLARRRRPACYSPS